MHNHAVQPLPLERFSQVVADAPLIALDLVVLRQAASGQQVLLGMRNNRPAQGFWFVPGGRIHKGEDLLSALDRTVQAELGLGLANLAAHQVHPRWLGVYQHRYADSFADAHISTHYVVLAHALDVPASLALPATHAPGQHSQWQWWDVAAAQTHPQVHAHTQDYLRPGRAIFGGILVDKFCNSSAESLRRVGRFSAET